METIIETVKSYRNTDIPVTRVLSDCQPHALAVFVHGFKTALMQASTSSSELSMQ